MMNEKPDKQRNNSDNNRSRLLLLLKYLQKNTDDKHVASVADITEMLENRGINGNRNTIRDDVKALNDAGYEILANVGPSNSKLYHYGARPFDEPELKLLIDAVSSSQFIGVKQSQDLIDKICELTSKYEAEKLVARVYTSERIKTENSKLLYVVDMINEAIDSGKKIRFQYMEYNADKELVCTNNGEWYENSPYAMLWNDDRYYLLGYSEKHNKWLLSVLIACVYRKLWMKHAPRCRKVSVFRNMPINLLRCSMVSCSRLCSTARII